MPRAEPTLLFSVLVERYTRMTHVSLSLLHLGLVLALLPSLSACGQSRSSDSSETEEVSPEPEAVNEEAEPTPARPSLDHLNVTVGEIDALGTLTAEGYGPVIQEGLDELSLCLRRAHRNRPGTIAGTVTLSLIIARDGNVGSSFIAGTDLRDDVMDRCISDAAREWTFPAVENGITRLLIPLQMPAP